MSDPFIAEIRAFGFNFAPRSWATCDGQLLPINQNQALFSLLGTQYGGNGTTNFALPDLRGRMPLHAGSGIQQGQGGGADSVTLSTANLPAHGHSVMASADLAAGASPAANVMGAKGRGGVDVYAAATNLTPLAAGAVGQSGSTQAHDNNQPSLVLNYCICLFGIFPSRN